MRHLLPVFLPFTLACGGAPFVTDFFPEPPNDGGATLDAQAADDRISTVEASPLADSGSEASTPALDAIPSPDFDASSNAPDASDGGIDRADAPSHSDAPVISCEEVSCTAGGAACCPPMAIYCGREDGSTTERCCWGGCQ